MDEDGSRTDEEQSYDKMRKKAASDKIIKESDKEQRRSKKKGSKVKNRKTDNYNDVTNNKTNTLLDISQAEDFFPKVKTNKHIDA